VDNPFSKLTATSSERHKQATLRQQAEAEGVPERRIALADIAPREDPVAPVRLPSRDDLRRKAQQCRSEAEGRTIPDLRAHLLEIAAEYERLAVRGAQFEERSRLPTANPMNAIALTQWFA